MTVAILVSFALGTWLGCAVARDREETCQRRFVDGFVRDPATSLRSRAAVLEYWRRTQ